MKSLLLQRYTNVTFLVYNQDTLVQVIECTSKKINEAVPKKSGVWYKNVESTQTYRDEMIHFSTNQFMWRSFHVSDLHKNKIM